jgi:hypothetical protein
MSDRRAMLTDSPKAMLESNNGKKKRKEKEKCSKKKQERVGQGKKEKRDPWPQRINKSTFSPGRFQNVALTTFSPFDQLLFISLFSCPFTYKL